MERLNEERQEILKLSKDQARSIISEEYYLDGDLEIEFLTIQNNIISQTRWETHYNIIVKRKSDNKYFKSSYSRGSTEYQDTRPYEHNEPVFSQIFPYMTMVTMFSDKPVDLTIERVINIRKQAINTLELTKGIPRTEPNRSLETLEELAGYILEMTNNI